MLRVIVLLAVLAAGYLAYAHLRRHAEFKRYTAYCHLQEILVRMGEEVTRGRIIGHMGMSGNAVGISHVHLELCTSACRSHADGDLTGTADPPEAQRRVLRSPEGLSAGAAGPHLSRPMRRGLSRVMNARMRRAMGALLLLACLTGCSPGAKPVLAAAAKGDNDAVRELLAKGAKPGRAGAEGMTPLMVAAQHGHAEVARTLVDAGADVNAKRSGPERGRTALIDAAWSGRTEIVRQLLAKRAEPNAKAEDGATALTGAALRGYTEIVRLLLVAKADPNARADDGRAPLHEAAKEGHGPEVEALLRRGADPNATNEAGVTPLMLAAFGGHAEVASMLLAWGADVNRTSRSGSTALRDARSRGHAALVDLLQQVGAKD